ncbi:hypothetical protein [Mesobacillus harenae]|uniref:hypothetical protein n=1 Tax=Mesobacillus harenae TaxID=2213203 RepID=UPI001580F0EB|nr:hypothetical protein [Mesobacillus harenae]
MDSLEGKIISGDFDKEHMEFSIQKIKEFETQSVVRETQLNSLYQYLKKHEDEQEGQIITLYDQMPVRLSIDEVKQFLEDLEKIKDFFH